MGSGGRVCHHPLVAIRYLHTLGRPRRIMITQHDAVLYIYAATVKKSRESRDQSSDCAQPDRETDLTSTQLARDHDSREKSVPLALSRRAAHKIDSTDLALLPELIHRREQKQANDETRADGSVSRMR